MGYETPYTRGYRTQYIYERYLDEGGGIAPLQANETFLTPGDNLRKNNLGHLPMTFTSYGGGGNGAGGSIGAGGGGGGAGGGSFISNYELQNGDILNFHVGAANQDSYVEVNSVQISDTLATGGQNGSGTTGGDGGVGNDTSGGVGGDAAGNKGGDGGTDGNGNFGSGAGNGSGTNGDPSPDPVGGGGGGGAGSTTGGVGGPGFITNRITDPFPQFNASPSSGSAPLSVTFTDTSTGFPTTWVWEYQKRNAGSYTQFSTVQNPVQSFAVGQYDIRLTVSNQGGSLAQVFTDAVISKTTLFPVAYWKMNSNRLRTTGDVDLTNGSGSYVTGKYGNALLGSAASSSTNTTKLNGISLKNGWSCSYWFKTGTAYAERRAANTSTYAGCYASTTDLRVILGASFDQSVTPSLSAGDHHVAFVADAGTMKIYVDGSLFNSLDISAVSGSFASGYFTAGTALGYIDEIAWFDFALSAGQVSTIAGAAGDLESVY